jgi:hypothetical protein
MSSEAFKMKAQTPWHSVAVRRHSITRLQLPSWTEHHRLNVIISGMKTQTTAKNVHVAKRRVETLGRELAGGESKGRCGVNG